MHDLHILPKVRDSWSHLYVEHCRIDQEDKAIALHDASGVTHVPCATLNLLMLGPGVTITHAAIRTLAEHGCTVLWVGEHGVRLYAQGLGETRSSLHLMRQARLWADPILHLRVVRQMYQMRFPDPLDPSLTLQQIRGKEGIRVREKYAEASRAYGVEWHGRAYNRSDWSLSDPVNRALSSANACLYGVCHAAIVAAGYSPALGFVHTGKQLSFVYDIADLYKMETTVPAAFHAISTSTEGVSGLEGRVRQSCRDLFHRERLLQRIVDDLDHLLTLDDSDPVLSISDENVNAGDEDQALPGGIWDLDSGFVSGGVNYADELINDKKQLSHGEITDHREEPK